MKTMPHAQDQPRLAGLADQLWRKALEIVSPAKVNGFGMDLTEVKRLRGERGRSLASSFLSAREWRLCETMHDPTQGWSMLWAAREAVYKAVSGRLEVYPLLWRFTPRPEGGWKARPVRENEAWKAFDQAYSIHVHTGCDEIHAVAVALVTTGSGRGPDSEER